MSKGEKHSLKMDPNHPALLNLDEFKLLPVNTNIRPKEMLVHAYYICINSIQNKGSLIKC